jgi:hypothetical protein
MKDEDLEQFAVADGLLARIIAEPGYLTDAEKNYLLFQAARRLALAADLKGEEAYRLIYPMTPETGPPSRPAPGSPRSSPGSASCSPSAAMTCADSVIPT